LRRLGGLQKHFYKGDPDRGRQYAEILLEITDDPPRRPTRRHGVIAKIIPRRAARDDRAGALIGYIERDGREGVDARLDDAGNLIAYVSRDARDGAVLDVEHIMAARKHFLSRVPDVDPQTGEVVIGEYPVETQGVLSLDTAALEFRAVATESRATNPYVHLVLSWRDGKQPTNSQPFEAGRSALAALNLDEHQYVMAVHRGETGNDHLHIAVNRVHPETYRAQHLSKSYYELDRAMREIELRQGWERDNGPYEVRYCDGVPEIVRASAGDGFHAREDDASANVKDAGARRAGMERGSSIYDVGARGRPAVT